MDSETQENKETVISRLSWQYEITASKDKVWKVLFSDSTYRQWTVPFGAGSYFEGNWEAGETIRFLNQEQDGLLSKILEHIPNEKVVVEHIGLVFKGENDLKSEAALALSGAQEIYHLEESSGITTLTVLQDMDEKYQEQMTQLFAIIKQLAEK